MRRVVEPGERFEPRAYAIRQTHDWLKPHLDHGACQRLEHVEILEIGRRKVIGRAGVTKRGGDRAPIGTRDSGNAGDLPPPRAEQGERGA